MARSCCPHDDLNAILKSADPGEVLQLEPGEYGPLTIKGQVYDEPVTILGGPGVLMHGISSYDSAGVNFIDLDLTTGPNNHGGAGIARNYRCQRLRFEKVLVHGTLDDAGVLFDHCGHCAITDSELTACSQTIRLVESDDCASERNHIHHHRSDAHNMCGGSNHVFRHNLIHDTAMYPQDHCDTFQGFRNQGNRNLVNILIEENVYFVGRGVPAQGPFFRNLVGQDVHRNIVVKDNILIGPMGNGIYGSGIDGFTITGNMVWGPTPPTIKWSDNDGPTTNVICENNVCHHRDPAPGCGNVLIPIPAPEGVWQVFMALPAMAAGERPPAGGKHGR